VISWIVASHDSAILTANLGASLEFGPDDELIVVENAPSITIAYAEGQDRATQPVRAYVHHDVQILNNERLSALLIENCAWAGVVGIVGSRTPVLPWWSGACCGSVVDERVGPLNLGPGGQCAMLDGLLLATARHIDWDTSMAGWHGYDHDACLQMLTAGHLNFCLNSGHELVRHNTAGAFSMPDLTGWEAAAERLRSKWGVIESGFIGTTHTEGAR
jgi:hypothetical protein